MSFVLFLESTLSFSRDFSLVLSLDLSGLALFDLLWLPFSAFDLLRRARSFKGLEAARFKVFECLAGECFDRKRVFTGSSELSEDDRD